MELETWNFAQINFRTIQFDTSDETNLIDILASIKSYLFFGRFQEKAKFGSQFWQKTDFLCEKHQISILLTDRGFNYPFAAILRSLSS